MVSVIRRHENNQGMKIAQVAPLAESVPPKLYGGTERIVSYLTEELVRQGHSVTLFASGDSVTSARLRPAVEMALRLTPNIVDSLVFSVLQLEDVRACADQFDVIHFHTDYLHFPIARDFPATPRLNTLHGRLDLPGYAELFGRFPDAGVVSISDHQRLPLPHARWLGTVYHGLATDLCRPPESPHGDYLAFLGRISPEKRVDRAIEIARLAGMPLKIAAKIDNADLEYFQTEIEPLMNQSHVEFVGEIGERDKCDFLGHARALLFPIDWPEPFGLVMIEAMSCGTPTIAWRAGSVPEVITEGVNGFICDSIDEAVAAVRACERCDRARVRASFLERFSAKRMTDDYLKIYQQLVADDLGKVAA